MINEAALAILVTEYLRLRERNASDEEFRTWRERVRERFPYEGDRMLVQVREALEAKEGAGWVKSDHSSTGCRTRASA